MEAIIYLVKKYEKYEYCVRNDLPREVVTYFGDTDAFDKFTSIKEKFVIMTNDKVFLKLTGRKKLIRGVWLRVGEHYLMLSPTRFALMVNHITIHHYNETVFNLPMYGTHYYDSKGVRVLKSLKEIEQFLMVELHTKQRWALDIEGYGLRIGTEIASISFSGNSDTATVFTVSWHANGHHNDFEAVKRLMMRGFEKYKGKFIAHNAAYEGTQVSFNLWMDFEFGNRKGMVKATRHFTSKLVDTMLMCYTTHNSSQAIPLGLKENAKWWFGDWGDGVDVKDITKMDTDTLLKYNGVDTMATFKLYEDRLNAIVNQDLIKINTLLMGMIPVMNMVMLNGMKVNMTMIHALGNELSEEIERLARGIESTESYRQLGIETQAASISFVRIYIATHVHYNVVDYENEKVKADGEAIKKYIASSQGEVSQVLKDFLKIVKMSKMYGTYVKGIMDKTVYAKNGDTYVLDEYRINGTVSGRMSSKLVMLMPKGGEWGQRIRECFEIPDNGSMVSDDYKGLESRIAAALYNDPMHEAVFKEGYDSHSLYTYKYAENKPDVMTDIKREVEASTAPKEKVDAINSIQHRYPELRKNSKARTFLLNYLGTYIAMMKQGVPELEARESERVFHEMHHVYFDKVEKALEVGKTEGYVKLAMGHRIAVPAMAQNIGWLMGDEFKSVANATCQSYSLLLTKAAVEMMALVWQHEEYCDKIIPAFMIHDDIGLYLYEVTPAMLKWVNDNLVPLMQFNDEEPIKHDYIELENEVLVHKGSWYNGVELKNYASLEECEQVLIESRRRNEDEKVLPK